MSFVKLASGATLGDYPDAFTVPTLTLALVGQLIQCLENLLAPPGQFQRLDVNDGSDAF